MATLSVNPHSLSPKARKLLELLPIIDDEPQTVLDALSIERAGSVGQLIDTEKEEDLRLFFFLAEEAARRTGGSNPDPMLRRCN